MFANRPNNPLAPAGFFNSEDEPALENPCAPLTPPHEDWSLEEFDALLDDPVENREYEAFVASQSQQNQFLIDTADLSLAEFDALFDSGMTAPQPLSNSPPSLFALQLQSRLNTQLPANTGRHNKRPADALFPAQAKHQRSAAQNQHTKAPFAITERDQALLLAHGFSRQNLSRLCDRLGKNKGARSTLVYLVKHIAALRETFKPDQLISVASNDGGAHALENLIDKSDQLKAAGFAIQQIVKIAGNDGGAQALEKLIEKSAELRAAGFSTEQIVKIAGNIGGTQALEKLIEKSAGLRAAGYSTEQIVKIAGNKGSAKTLEKLTEKSEWLKAAGLTTEEIVKVAGRRGGAKAIENLIANWPN